jgi:hypothetical protein
MGRLLELCAISSKLRHLVRPTSRVLAKAADLQTSARAHYWSTREAGGNTRRGNYR